MRIVPLLDTRYDGIRKMNSGGLLCTMYDTIPVMSSHDWYDSRQSLQRGGVRDWSRTGSRCCSRTRDQSGCPENKQKTSRDQSGCPPYNQWTTRYK